MVVKNFTEYVVFVLPKFARIYLIKDLHEYKYLEYIRVMKQFLGFVANLRESDHRPTLSVLAFVDHLLE